MSESFDYKFVLYSDYDADGDGYLSPNEYDAYKAAGGIDYEGLPKITQEDLDAIEADAGSGTSVSPYEDGSAADDFYGGFPNPYADLSETEVNAAIIEAADAGEVDVMNAIISATTTAISAAAQNAATTALYTSIFGDSLSVPEGLLGLTNPDGSSYGYGSNGTSEIPTIQYDDYRDQHADTVDAIKNAEAAAEIYGGTVDQYFTTPNQVSAAQLAITQYDADGDGSLSPQEMDEYVKDYELESGIMYFTDGTEAGGSLAQAADTDGDGVVSVEELAQFNEDRGSDQESESSRARREFLEDFESAGTPGAIFLEQFNRESGESFTSGAMQILQQSIQDASLGLLNSIQQGILTQIESGDDTITRPTLDKDDPSYAIIGQDIDSYLDRIFAGGDTVPKDTLLTNDEFYDVGIRLATSIQQTPMMDSNDIQIERTNQDLIDRYVAVRDDYQESIAEPETPIGRFIDDVQQDLDELFKDVPDSDVKAKAARDGIQAMLDGAEAFFEQDTVQTAQAVTLKAAGDLMQSAAGAVALMGNNPADTALHQLGTELATLGNETYTQEFKVALTDIDKRIGAAEGFWDTAEAIFGALEEHPTEFLVDKIGSELLQEIPLLLASGGAAALAKGGAGAIKVGKEIADKWAENAGFVTGVALDLGEAIAANAGGAYEDAIENLLKEGVVNPTTGKAYTQEEAEAKAVEIATNTGLVGGLITAATMGIGGNLFEKSIGKADGIERLGNAIFTQAPEAVKKAINKYLGEMGTRVVGIGGATAGETLQEAIDETVTSLTTDVQMEAAGDLDRDYGATAASSLIIGGMTGGTIAGTISTGSAASYWVKTSNAQVAAAVAAAEASVLGGASPKDAAAQLQTELTDLGVDSTNIQNDLANSVDDAGYLTQQEVFDTATELNVELLPDQIADYAGQTDELAHMEDLIDGLTKNIYGAPSDAEFDVNNDGVLTGQELVEREQAMEVWEENNPDFETLGTPSLSELDTDGVSGLSSAELTAYANAVGEVVTQRDSNIDDTRARFRALGYEPSNTEVFEYSGKKDQIRGYVDPRQLTQEELEAVAAAENYTLQDSDYDRVGQGGADFEVVESGNATTAFDSLALSTQEIKDAAAAEGFAISNAEATALAGNVAADTTEAEALKIEQDKFDAGALNAQEISDAAAAAGYTLEAGEAESLARTLRPGVTETEALASQEADFDSRAITLAELEAIAAEQGYTLTDADKALVGNVTEGTDSSVLDAKSTEFDDLVITEAELEAVAAATGYTLTDEDRGLIGAVGEGESAAAILGTQRGVYDTRVGNLEAAAARQGYEDTIRGNIEDNGGAFTEAEIQGFIDQAVSDGSVNGAIGVITTQRTDQNNIARIQDETGVSATEAAALLDQVDPNNTLDQVIANQQTANTNATNEANIRTTFPNLSDEEVAVLMGQINNDTSVDQVIANQQAENTNVVNEASIRTAFPNLSDEEVATLMGQINNDTSVDQVIANQQDAGTDTNGEGTEAVETTEVDEGPSTFDQVVAIAVAAGVELTQEQIDRVVSDVESGVTTDIDTAVKEAGGINTDTDTNLSDEVVLDETTIEGSQNDYVRVGDFNREVGTLQNNLIKLINQLEANGIARDDAIKQAIGVPAGQEGGPSGLYAELGKFATADQVTALDDVIDGVASKLGTTADDVAAIKDQMTNLATREEVETIVAGEIEGLATQQDVLDAEGRLKIRIGQLEAEGKSRFDAIDIALGELATELGTTQDNVTQALNKFQLDISADIADLATKKQVADVESNILARIKTYEDQGYSRDVAIQKSLADANQNIEQLADDLGTTKDELTQQLTDFQAKLDADLSKLATKEQVSELEADLYIEIQRLENAGIARDEATQLAVGNLATELGLTKDQMLDRIGTTEQNLTTYIGNVETKLANQIETEAQTTRDTVTDTATETQRQIQEANRQSAFRDFFDLVAGSEDLEGQTVTVGQSPLAQIDYVYDFQSPFATKQQAGFYGSASPYGVPMAAAKQRRPQGLGSIMQGPLNLGGRPPGMAKGGKVDYDFLGEISQIMSFGD